MTAQELYNWAKEHNVLNADIVFKTGYDDFGRLEYMPLSIECIDIETLDSLYTKDPKKIIVL